MVEELDDNGEIPVRHLHAHIIQKFLGFLV